MGKKTKVGKQRKDKYYRLAKETGYRSRAAFKLIQLNRKYDFLQRSQVLVDLCAAPGGWMQVAAQHMPVSSLIIGVDLCPIRPGIGNAICIQDDITTDSCRKAIKREMKTFAADCVLHDGAPNVGQNWIHDAFMQAKLTLSAFKLATEVLRKGGWFVTKVFRSKDYPALLPVFQALFKQVHVTKPQASRNESAEIFVVCEHFKKPEKVDPALVDPKEVFKDAEIEPQTKKLNLLKPDKQKKAKAEGYKEGATTLFQQMNASDFIRTSDLATVLADVNEIVIDDDEIRNHPSTSKEVLECCRDIKVLGRTELKQLLTWRKKLKQHFKNIDPKPAHESATAETVELTAEEKQEQLDQQIKESNVQDAKRQRRKDVKLKRKYRERIETQTKYGANFEEDFELFSLSRLRGTKQAHDSDDSGVSSDDEGRVGELPAKNSVVDFVDEDTRKTEFEQQWFKRGILGTVVTEDLQEAELDQMAGTSKAEPVAKKRKLTSVDDVKYDASKAVVLSGAVTSAAAVKGSRFERKENEEDDEPSDIEMVAADESDALTTKKLTPEALALGEAMIYSTKTRRDLMDWGWNKYANNDDNLPDWFTDDEKKHHRAQLPVTKEQVQYYKDRVRDINTRPIKKIAEAKARKKKKSQKRLERAKKKAEGISANEEMTDREKSKEMRRVVDPRMKKDTRSDAPKQRGSSRSKNPGKKRGQPKPTRKMGRGRGKKR